MFNHCVTSFHFLPHNAQKGWWQEKKREFWASKANEIVVYLHGKVLRHRLRSNFHKFSSLFFSLLRKLFSFLEKWKSIIHIHGQKAWSTLLQPPSYVPSDIFFLPSFSIVSLLLRSKALCTKDFAELDGSSLRMCTLICFLRILFRFVFFLVNHLDLSLSIQREMFQQHTTPHSATNQGKNWEKERRAWWNLPFSLSYISFRIFLETKRRKSINESRFRRRETPGWE